MLRTEAKMKMEMMQKDVIQQLTEMEWSWVERRGVYWCFGGSYVRITADGAILYQGIC